MNYPIEVANFKTGDVLVLDTAKGKIVNMPKDEIKSSDVSATGEANKIVRLDSDGILHADISGSASILDGVAVSMSGAKDGQVLIYNGASKKIVPSTDISGSAQKVNGVGINPNSLVNGKAVAYDSKTKMLVADTNNYLLDSDVSDTGKATGEGTFDGSKNCEINVTKISTTYAETSDTATTSAKADKLTTPRKISIGGKVTANAVNFDGSGDVVLNLSVLKSLEVTNPVAETSFAKLAGSANYAAECAKALSAVNDNDGNPITSTYVKKSELESLTANTDVSSADEVEENFITLEQLMEILAQYVTKADLRNAVADVIGEDEITDLFEGGN